jgi:hypothetical protein
MRKVYRRQRPNAVPPHGLTRATSPSGGPATRFRVASGAEDERAAPAAGRLEHHVSSTGGSAAVLHDLRRHVPAALLAPPDGVAAALDDAVELALARVDRLPADLERAGLPVDLVDLAAPLAGEGRAGREDGNGEGGDQVFTFMAGSFRLFCRPGGRRLIGGT